MDYLGTARTNYLVDQLSRMPRTFTHERLNGIWRRSLYAWKSSSRNPRRLNWVRRRYKPVHRLAGMPSFLRYLSGHDAILGWELEARHGLIEDLAHDIDALAVGIPALHPVAIGGVDAGAVKMTTIRAEPMLHPNGGRVEHGER